MVQGLSVILACFNKENTIKTTIESIENQTLVKNNPMGFVEIICVDDGSTDRTVKEIEKLQNKYGNIILVRNQKNSGVFVTRLVGIRRSTKDHIIFVDPDDHLDETFHEELYDAAISTNADITQTPSVYKYYGPNKKELATNMFHNMPPGIIKVSPDNFNRIIYGNWLTMWNRMFKRDRMIKIAYFPPYYINFMEDIFIYISTMCISKTVCNVITKGHYYYNLSNDVNHLSGISFKNKSAPTAQIFQLIDVFLMESRNIVYHDCVCKFRNAYMRLIGEEYKKCFDITEKFTNGLNDYKNNISPYDRQREFRIIRDTYVELLKSNY